MMRILLFLLIFNKCFGQTSNPVCLTDSCKKKFLTYKLNHGSFPKECIMINFKDKSGNKWSEMVYVVSIHNYYYYSIDSVNTKKYIDSVYSAVYNGEYIFKDTSIDTKFGGYPLDKKTFNQMKGMPFDEFLYTYLFSATSPRNTMINTNEKLKGDVASYGEKNYHVQTGTKKQAAKNGLFFYCD